MNYILFTAGLDALRALTQIKASNKFSAEIFTIQIASLSILLKQSQVVSLNHWGSRIKHSCLRIYIWRTCIQIIFPSLLFTVATNGDYRDDSRNCKKFVH